jgi:hypothetical protein
LERWDGAMWTGKVWLRIGIGGELLWIRYWTYGFHEMLENYRVATRVVLGSIELVTHPRLSVPGDFIPAGLDPISLCTFHRTSSHTRKAFAPTREDITGTWRELQSNGVHICTLLSIV